MKMFLILIILLFPSLSLAASPESDWSFATSFDQTDWIQATGTFIAEYGDFQTSAEIPEQAASQFPGLREGNPLIRHAFGTSRPSEIQYAGWFTGEYITGEALAFILPKRLRAFAHGIFMGVGSVDSSYNGLGLTQYGGQFSIPLQSLTEGLDKSWFSAPDSVDIVEWSLASMTTSLNVIRGQQYSEHPPRALIVSQMILSSVVLTFIEWALPNRWRDMVLGYQTGISGAKFVLQAYR